MYNKIFVSISHYVQEESERLSTYFPFFDFIQIIYLFIDGNTHGGSVAAHEDLGRIHSEYTIIAWKNNILKIKIMTEMILK